MVTVRPACALVHWPRSRAAPTGRAEAGLAVVAVARIGVVHDRGGAPCGTGDAAGGKVELELVVGEVSLGRDRGLDLDPWVDAGGVQAGQQRPGAIGAIAVDGGRGRWRTVPGSRGCDRCRWGAVDLACQLRQQPRRRGRVADVARGSSVAVTSSLSGSTEACPL